MICLFLSTARYDPISAAIRCFTRCEFSHAGFLDTDTDRTFSAMMGGVKWRSRKSLSADRYLLFSVPKTQEAFEWALTQEGKKYDYSAITGLAFNRDWREEGSFFCSELLALAFEKVGAPLLNPGMSVYRITPRDLLLSPYIGTRG